MNIIPIKSTVIPYNKEKYVAMKITNTPTIAKVIILGILNLADK